MLENRMLIDEYFISDTKIKDEDYYNNMPDCFEERDDYGD